MSTTTSLPALTQAQDRRAVLLRGSAEQAWLNLWPGREMLRGIEMEPVMEAWATRVMAHSLARERAAGWAGRALGMEEEAILHASGALAAVLSDRLRLGDPSPIAYLCTEMLGWPQGEIMPDVSAWELLPGILIENELPVVILGPGDDLSRMISWADRIANAGIPVALRTNPGPWREFLASEAWDRASTRWRSAPVYEADLRLSAASTEYIRRQAPAAIPALERAQTELENPGLDGLKGARSAAEALLSAVLEARELTRHRFQLNTLLPFNFGRRAAEGDLAAVDARLVVEVDGYYHFQDADAYRRDRRKDALFQEHGWFVLRFLADDITGKLESVITEIERIYLLRRSILPISP